MSDVAYEGWCECTGGKVEEGAGQNGGKARIACPSIMMGNYFDHHPNGLLKEKGKNVSKQVCEKDLHDKPRGERD